MGEGANCFKVNSQTRSSAEITQRALWKTSQLLDFGIGIYVWIFQLSGESKGLGKISPCSGGLSYPDVLSLGGMWSGAK